MPGSVPKVRQRLEAFAPKHYAPAIKNSKGARGPNQIDKNIRAARLKLDLQ